MSILKDEWERLQAEWPDELADWKIEVSARITASGGYCYQSKKLIRIAEWQVLRAPKRELLDTIRHEVAHALTPGHGHDELWQFACLLTGAKPKRCYDDEYIPLAAKYRRRK